MSNLSRVFLPLRSNIGWFQSLNLQSEISNHVKESILLYDELYIEDGTFQADIVEGSAGSLKWYYPPGFIPLEKRTIEFERDLKPTGITIGIGPDGATSPSATILSGKASIRFKIDYDEIFKNVEKSDYNFLKFVVLQNEYDIPRSVQDIIQSQSCKDKNEFKNMHSNEVVRDLVIDNLNHDLAASILLNSSIIIDSTHHELLKRKCSHKESPLNSEPVIESIALHEILNVDVPDFSKLSMEQVLEFREEPSWNNLRDFLRSIALAVKEDPVPFSNLGHAERIIRYYAKELSNELEKKQTTGNRLGIELGLGTMSLIPGYGVIPTALSAAKVLKSYCDDRSTWFAFMSKLKKVK